MKGAKKMEKIKVVQIGCGKMSKYIMRYVFEKGGSVVGAVDINPDIIGKDIGDIMETEKKGVKVESIKELDHLLKTQKPQVAIIATMSILNDIEESLRCAIKNGVNVLTTCEEAFFPQNSNPILYQEIDALAKAFHVTVTGCGYQDIFWGNMVHSLCTSTHRITKIKGKSSYNVEDYGIALANAHGAGLTKEKFMETIASTNEMSEEERNALMNEKSFFPSYMWNVVGWLADKLGLSIVTMKQVCLPVICEEDLTSDTLKMTVKKDMVRGMSAIVSAMTKENILLEVECIGKIYTEEEEDMNEWIIYGEPTTKVLNEKPSTVELTCADIVNRIPQIIEMPSGFLPTSKYPEAKYIVSNFGE